MNYNEIKRNYSWTLKKYPQTNELIYCNDQFSNYVIGKVTIEKFKKSGCKWCKTESKREDVTSAYYFNAIDAVPFFRNLGGHERVICGYCVRGYVPLIIESISPDGKNKTKRTFKLF